MAGVLVFSEQETLRLELVAGAVEIARALQTEVEVALLAPTVDIATAAAGACFSLGARAAYVCGDSSLSAFREDVYAIVLAEMVERAGAQVVLVGASRRGRALAPRLAERLGAGCVNEAQRIAVQEGRLVAWRVALGGNTIKEEAIITPLAVVSVRRDTFERPAPPATVGAQELVGAAASAASDQGGQVFRVELELSPSPVVTLQRQEKPRGAVNIEDAERLVCVGRGLASKEDLPLIQRLAAALGAELAATRPLSYDYKWLPEDRMVGISGKTVSPQLYVVVGSSGQIQHTVSVRDARIIVAINKDPSAPIFELADYGIVGDLYEVVPRLTAALAGDEG